MCNTSLCHPCMLFSVVLLLSSSLTSLLLPIFTTHLFLLHVQKTSIEFYTYVSAASYSSLFSAIPPHLWPSSSRLSSTFSCNTAFQKPRFFSSSNHWASRFHSHLIALTKCSTWAIATSYYFAAYCPCSWKLPSPYHLTRSNIAATWKNYLFVSF